MTQYLDTFMIMKYRARVFEKTHNHICSQNVFSPGSFLLHTQLHSPAPGANPRRRRRTIEPGGDLARELLWDISRGDPWANPAIIFGLISYIIFGLISYLPNPFQCYISRCPNQISLFLGPLEKQNIFSW